MSGIGSAGFISRLKLTPNNINGVFYGPRPSFMPKMKAELETVSASVKPTKFDATRSPVSRLSLEGKNISNKYTHGVRRGFATSTKDQIKISQDDKNYKVSIPLPSGNEILFFLRGDQTVRNLVDEMRKEDSSVQNASVALGSVRVASSTPLDAILKNPFSIQINDKRYDVIPAQQTPVSAHHVPAFHKVETSPAKLEQLKQEIIPLLHQKLELDEKAHRQTNVVLWGGLGFLIAQWSILARMTWWDFNWDIMEPVTYFITFGTAVLGYAYFAVAKKDYSFTDLRHSILSNRMLKMYMKNNFDVDRYYTLEHELNHLDPTALETVKRLLEDNQLSPVQKIEAAVQSVEAAISQQQHEAQAK
jgi:hypothetical protein